MKAGFVLERCRSAEEDIEELKRQSARRKDVLKGGDNATIEAELEQLKAELASRRKEYKAELAAVTAMLDMLPGVTGEIMHRFYVKRESYSVIAAGMNYSASYIRKCVGTGRKKLGRLQHADMLKLLPVWYIEKFNRLEVE